MLKNLTLFNNNNIDINTEIGIILPYAGKYSIKAIIKNSKNFEFYAIEKDFITVDIYNVDFIGFYSQLDGTYEWDANKKKTQQLHNKKRDL